AAPWPYAPLFRPGFAELPRALGERGRPRRRRGAPRHRRRRKPTRRALRRRCRIFGELSEAGTYLRPAPPECEDGGRPRGATTSTLPGTMLKRLLILGVGFLVGCGADSCGPVDGDALGSAPGTDGAGGAKASGGSSAADGDDGSGGAQGGKNGSGGQDGSGGDDGDDDSPCDDGDSRTLTCGTNDNGTRLQECVDGRWKDHGCDD